MLCRVLGTGGGRSSTVAALSSSTELFWHSTNGVWNALMPQLDSRERFLWNVRLLIEQVRDFFFFLKFSFLSSFRRRAPFFFSSLAFSQPRLSPKNKKTFYRRLDEFFFFYISQRGFISFLQALFLSLNLLTHATPFLFMFFAFAEETKKIVSPSRRLSLYSFFSLLFFFIQKKKPSCSKPSGAFLWPPSPPQPRHLTQRAPPPRARRLALYAGSKPSC